MPVLTYTDGQTPRQIEFDKPRFTMGKRQTNDLVLNDVKISREHCEIVASGSGYVLRDLGSRNGTFVDGARVVGEAPLRDGAVVQLASLPVPVTFNLQAPPAGAKFASCG